MKTFWKQLEDEIKNKCSLVKIKDIPKSVILFGCAPNFVSNSIFDMLIVLAKFYIYRQKVQDKLPYFKSFLKDLKYEYTCEKYNATIRSTEHKFKQKWLSILPLIDIEVEGPCLSES